MNAEPVAEKIPETPPPERVSSVTPPNKSKISSLWVLGALSCISLLACLLLWQKIGTIQEQLARQSADAQNQSSEARALSKQSLALAQETAARAALFESRLSEVALQRSQLEDLMQSLSRSRDENLVVDIESALRLAQQQAQLSGSIEPLLSALHSAEQRVNRAAQPRLALLQRAIARDIDRVKAAAVSDTPTLLIKLDEVVRLSDELVPANAAPTKLAPAHNQQSGTTDGRSWWQSSADILLEQARSLVRISRIEVPEAALLSPEQAFFLRENFKLKLLNARLGLLSRQVESARSDLASAEVTLKKYFDLRSRQTQTTAALLAQIQTQMRQLQLPRIDETLAVLVTAAAGR
jgi:uroporphyrin-3 C-methyltransferase